MAWGTGTDAGYMIVGVSASDASNFRVSAFTPNADASNQMVSAKSLDAGLLLTSAKSGDGSQLRTSSLSPDASTFRVSAIGTNTVSAGLSESNSFIGQVSAIIKNYPLTVSGTISSFINQGTVSAYSPDAALFRVSSIGGGAGDNTLVGGQDQTLSASVQRVSGVVSAGYNAVLVYSQNRDDASNLRTSAFVDSGSISAKSSDAGTHLVSAKQGDAGLFRVSAIGSISAILQGGTSNIGDVSALSPDAGLFRISAINSISSLSPDAGLFRVSSLTFDAEYTASPNVVVSARGTTVTSAMKGLVTATVIADAAFGRVSAFVDSGSISAKSSDAGTHLVSAKSGSADQLRISAIVDNGSISAKSSDAGTHLISAKQGDAGLLHASAFVDSGSISAKNQDANFMHISGFSPDAGLFRVSSMGADAGNDRTSALQGSADLLRVSGIQGDAGNLRTSALPPQAGLYSTYRSISVSSAVNVKSTAGAIFGINAYYVSASTLAFLKFYNTSATPTLGTDVPVMTFALSSTPGATQINSTYPNGIKFTNGIALGAVSAIADNASTKLAASSLILNLYYI